MKKTVKLFSLLMVICMLLSSCAQSAGEVANIISDSIVKSDDIGNTLDTGITNTSSDSLTIGSGNNSYTEHLSASSAQNKIPEKGTYNEGVALVKYDGEMDDNVLSQLNLVSTTALYSGSTWYTVELAAGADTVETVTYLREVGCFDKVDYDYIMKADGEVQSVDISGNTYAEDLTYLETLGVKKGWESNLSNGKTPGGSPDVVIAIIDTGVDYNHLDLRGNIWVNSAEIPNNNRDDDGNGYVDDVYGWDCVGNDNDPMDDNGHGTHVAGIAVAENNKIGTVGVAYNCKIMVLKAGNSSGYFNNSDIAEAIQYAYMNGASVINMSFGGSSISLAVEEALENAYYQCVLVAAAGNDSRCNQPLCKIHKDATPIYPAVLPYVIGVMSTKDDGREVSSFSNFDHTPCNSFEYEVYAVGESIISTWPGNKYTKLNGTSMAAPAIAGIAAILRSYYSDREIYSAKFIQSQIVNTGTITPYYSTKEPDLYHSVANVYEALTRIPGPNVYLYDYYIDDAISISNVNNGNGIIDAGETVRLSIALQNRGGVASNVNVTIDTMRNNDPSLTDPYFTFVNNTIQLSDIGTYSVRECYEDQYFEIVVDADCPNDYLVDFNIRFTYTNGLDEKDNKSYSGAGGARFNISRGYHLSGIITEDTVYIADRLYIVGEDVIIPAGVTVTFEEGCDIQFYDDRDYYNSPAIYVYGKLNLYGSKDNMIDVYPSERESTCECRIVEIGGIVNCDYVSFINAKISANSITNSYLKIQSSSGNVSRYENGMLVGNYSTDRLVISANVLENNYIEATAWRTGSSGSSVKNNLIAITRGHQIEFSASEFTDNIIVNIDEGLQSGSDYGFGFSIYSNSINNKFITVPNLSLEALVPLSLPFGVDHCEFSDFIKQYAPQVIKKYYDTSGNPTVDVYGSLSSASVLWPHVVSVEMFDKDGNSITTVGREEIKVRVTFNRAMDTTQDTFLTFGTIEPYADYRIDGEWVSDTVWEGSYSLKAQIENGQNFLKVNNACAAEDPTKTVFGEYQLHEFTIDTTAAMSMNLQAIAKENGIELTFAQDDYDTLLGYNIYRADSKDGNYVKLNPAILLPSDSTFLDENAEPGKTYWYTYTVVLTDFTESNPAGKVQATAMDTLAPNMYHTPVNQGYTNNNLVISCTASDNVAISAVTLYYRAVGATEWKTLSMSKQSNKYSATIFGSEVTLAGLEYYIVASDGINTITKGDAETPHTVIVKDASAISRKGDVDGDGVVTTKDALMLMQCINGDLILTDDEFKRADLNGDGVLNSSEALRILQYINGKVNTLEM